MKLATTRRRRSRFPRRRLPKTAGQAERGTLARRVHAFHHLGAAHLRDASGSLERGDDVICLTADAATLEKLDGRVRVLGPDGLPDFEHVTMTPAYFDLIDELFDELAASALLMPFLRARLSDDISFYFRRTLVGDVSGLAALAALAASLRGDGYSEVVVDRRWPQSHDYRSFLLAWRRIEADPRRRPALSDDMRAGFQALQIGSPTRAIRDVAGHAVSAVRSVATVWLRVARYVRPMPGALPRGGLLMRNYASDWGVDLEGHRRLRNVDFLVDGADVRPEDVVMWLEPGTEPRAELFRARGYGTLARRDVRIGVRAFARRVLPLLLGLTIRLPLILRGPRWWHRPVELLVSSYAFWNVVSRETGATAFVSVNDNYGEAIARNIAFRATGCTSVNYQYTSHWWADERTWIIDYMYAYAVVDVLVSWGTRHSAHFAAHRGSIRQFWEVGCLWSEHAQHVSDDDRLRRAYEESLRTHARAPLEWFTRRVGVFDTSVGNILRKDDLAAFYEGVARLAHHLPDVLFVFKPKNPPDRLLAALTLPELDTAPNVVILPDTFETAAVVGLCDLSINAVYTSTLVESMGCGKPAVYYNPTKRMPNVFWRAMPGVLTDTDEALHESVSTLLETDAAAYRIFLDRHCADLDGHFDSRAITRLRGRLASLLAENRPAR